MVTAEQKTQIINSGLAAYSASHPGAAPDWQAFRDWLATEAGKRVVNPADAADINAYLASLVAPASNPEQVAALAEFNRAIQPAPPKEEDFMEKMMKNKMTVVGGIIAAVLGFLFFGPAGLLLGIGGAALPTLLSGLTAPQAPVRPVVPPVVPQTGQQPPQQQVVQALPLSDPRAQQWVRDNNVPITGLPANALRLTSVGGRVTRAEFGTMAAANGPFTATHNVVPVTPGVANSPLRLEAIAAGSGGAVNPNPPAPPRRLVSVSSVGESSAGSEVSTASVGDSSTSSVPSITYPVTIDGSGNVVMEIGQSGTPPRRFRLGGALTLTEGAKFHVTSIQELGSGHHPVINLGTYGFDISLDNYVGGNTADAPISQSLETTINRHLAMMPQRISLLPNMPNRNNPIVYTYHNQKEADATHSAPWVEDYQEFEAYADIDGQKRRVRISGNFSADGRILNAAYVRVANHLNVFGAYVPLNSTAIGGGASIPLDVTPGGAVQLVGGNNQSRFEEIVSRGVTRYHSRGVVNPADNPLAQPGSIGVPTSDTAPAALLVSTGAPAAGTVPNSQIASPLTEDIQYLTNLMTNHTNSDRTGFIRVDFHGQSGWQQGYVLLGAPNAQWLSRSHNVTRLGMQGADGSVQWLNMLQPGPIDGLTPLALARRIDDTLNANRNRINPNDLGFFQQLRTLNLSNRPLRDADVRIIGGAGHGPRPPNPDNFNASNATPFINLHEGRTANGSVYHETDWVAFQIPVADGRTETRFCRFTATPYLENGHFTGCDAYNMWVFNPATGREEAVATPTQGDSGWLATMAGYSLGNFSPNRENTRRLLYSNPGQRTININPGDISNVSHLQFMIRSTLNLIRSRRTGQVVADNSSLPALPGVTGGDTPEGVELLPNVPRLAAVNTSQPTPDLPV